nr:MAG: peptidase S39 [Chemarfal virus 59]
MLRPVLFSIRYAMWMCWFGDPIGRDYFERTSVEDNSNSPAFYVICVRTVIWLLYVWLIGFIANTLYRTFKFIRWLIAFVRSVPSQLFDLVVFVSFTVAAGPFYLAYVFIRSMGFWPSPCVQMPEKSSKFQCYTSRMEAGVAWVYLGDKKLGPLKSISARKEMATMSEVHEAPSEKMPGYLLCFYRLCNNKYEVIGLGTRVSMTVKGKTTSVCVTAAHVVNNATHMSKLATHGRWDQTFCDLTALDPFSYVYHSKEDEDDVVVIDFADRQWSQCVCVGYRGVASVKGVDSRRTFVFIGAYATVHGWNNPVTQCPGFYTSSGPITCSDRGIAKHGASTTNGWSGSPMLVYVNGNAFFGGVHTGHDGSSNLCTLWEKILYKLNGPTEVAPDLAPGLKPDKESPHGKRRRAFDAEDYELRREDKHGYHNDRDTFAADRAANAGKSGFKRAQREKNDDTPPASPRVPATTTTPPSSAVPDLVSESDDEEEQPAPAAAAPAAAVPTQAPPRCAPQSNTQGSASRVSPPSTAPPTNPSSTASPPSPRLSRKERKQQKEASKTSSTSSATQSLDSATSDAHQPPVTSPSPSSSTPSSQSSSKTSGPASQPSSSIPSGTPDSSSAPQVNTPASTASPSPPNNTTKQSKSSSKTSPASKSQATSAPASGSTGAGQQPSPNSNSTPAPAIPTCSQQGKTGTSWTPVTSKKFKSSYANALKHGLTQAQIEQTLLLAVQALASNKASGTQ